MIDFNINDYVHVKLTEVGISEMKRQHKELKEIFPNRGEFKPPNTDDDGWSKWQMHSLMHTFGHLCMGDTEAPFETTIRVEV